jgi:hypothetical protein
MVGKEGEGFEGRSGRRGGREDVGSVVGTRK